MKQKNINWCVCSEDWTPWVSCDQAVWPGDKTKISPIPGSFSRNFHTFLLSYFMYFFYNCVLFDVDWISGDWRPHEAEAPVYVLLWTGGTLILFIYFSLNLPWFNISLWWLQRVQPFDKSYQYLLFAAEPYEIVAFKVFSYFWTFFALCFCLCFCSLLYIFRCPARRLTSPLQISSRTGILTPRCSRLLHLLLFLVCHGKLDLSKCLRVICILYKHLNGLAACLINVCGEEIMIIQFSEEALSSSFWLKTCFNLKLSY